MGVKKGSHVLYRSEQRALIYDSGGDGANFLDSLVRNPDGM